MSRCEECGQPVHPHQLTCGSCGASLRDDRPRRAPEFPLEKPDESETFTLDDPLEPDVHGPHPDERERGGPTVESLPTPPDPAPTGPTVASLPTDPEPDPSAASSTARRRRRRRVRARTSGAESSPAFVSRAWALVVDAMVLFVGCSLLPGIARVGIRAAEAVSGSTELYDDVLIEQLTTVGQVALVAAYFVFMHADGQTLGKALMGLHVVRTDGAPLDPVMSLGRLCGYVFSALPLGFGFLLAAFKPRRALHDYLVGTIVVRPRDMPNAESEDEEA